MQRISDLEPELMDAEQRRLYDVIVATRAGGLGGPFSVLVRTPHIASPANGLHNAFRLTGRLDRASFEMLVLAVARKHRAAYAWAVHEALARKAGLPEPIIGAIDRGVAPDSFESAEQKQVFKVASELLETRDLMEETYRAASECLGSELLIEAVAAVGFYSMLCLVLNGFRVPASKAATIVGTESGASTKEASP